MARVVGILFAMTLLAGCAGTSRETSREPATETTAEIECGPDGLVGADDVDVTGRRVEAVAGIILSTEQLTSEQQDLVDWSLDRFGTAGLRLPPRIEVVFDETRSMCHGEIAECRPDQGIPVLYICGTIDPSDSSALLDQRLVLMHELAHVWHWSRGDGSSWPDYSAIVGGEHQNDEVPASNRAEERVAMIISWGLLDQVHRPVLTDMSCEERYLMFRTLTGVAPLGPLEPSCLPA